MRTATTGSDSVLYELLPLLPYPVYEYVACFVLRLDECEHEYNIILRPHPTWVSPNNVSLVANAWYDCSTRHDMPSEFGISARERPSAKKRQILYNFEPAGRIRSREEPSGRQL